MRNITEKICTLRTAKAGCGVRMQPETMKRLLANDVPKPDILAIARAAGVMAAKKTPDLIPYCHSVPLDCVKIEYTFSDTTVQIEAEVTAIWKTGVEMEALVAANLCAITVYDMLKPIDKNMEMLPSTLIEKKGGKSDYKEKLPRDFKAAVIVTSDGTAAGKREDKSGVIIRERLKELGIENIDYLVLPDDVDKIRAALLGYCEKGAALIITTGGTGLGPRDVTVEATRTVIEREMPAVVAAMQSYGQARTPYAMLSRALAGARGNTVMVNLPGSSRGTIECLNAIFPALLHVYKMMRGGGH